MMKRNVFAGIGLGITLALLLVGGNAMATETKGKTKPVVKEPPAAAAPATLSTLSGGDADELRKLMDAHALSELRTTYNGSYGASLLFNTDKLTYYVVLFKNKDFWRVIRTDAVGEAETVYRTFVTQTEQLAQVDIDTIRLDAGKKYTERQLAQNQNRLQSLQEDLARQQQQAQQVATAQQQARQQAVSLTGELRSSSAALDTVQQNIRQLEAQQANPSLALPEATSSGAPAAPPMNNPVATSPAQP
jgi:hypothetical protein